MAGLGAGVADRSSRIDAAGARDGAGARQYRFKKCGFTALEWAHQCNAPGTAGTSDVLSHRRLLIWSSALDWVGKPMLRLHRRFGKTEKRRWIVSRTRCSALGGAPQSRDPFANEMDPGSAAHHAASAARCAASGERSLTFPGEVPGFPAP